MIHISQVSPKTALNLSKSDMINDWYHNTIKNAAQHLVLVDCGNLTYGGQYSSGSTFWDLSPNWNNSVLVSSDEALETLHRMFGTNR